MFDQILQNIYITIKTWPNWVKSLSIFVRFKLKLSAFLHCIFYLFGVCFCLYLCLYSETCVYVVVRSQSVLFTHKNLLPSLTVPVDCT